MQQKTSETLVNAVKEQYETFPFPPIYTIEEEDVRRDLKENYNLEFGLSGNRKLKQTSKIWVPGCGTRWAVMTALQFKDIEIVASDLSENSLSIQSELAHALNITNIEFRHENLLETNYDSIFDFISCVGVLHHLPDPRIGFKIIARALKDTGIAEIMVYDKWNRHYSLRMQEIIKIFDSERKLNATERFELASRVLRSANQREFWISSLPLMS
jgi:SAM-dependent methyltransferase